MLKLAALLVVLSATLAACGGGGDDGSSSSAGGGSGPKLAIAADPSGGLKFTKTELSAKVGTVEIDFTNDSQTPHDVVIARDGDDVAKTDVVTGGDASASADLTAGTYTFYCSVAGHRQAGMEGTLTVS